MFQVKSFWCVKLVGFFASFLWGSWCTDRHQVRKVVKASLAWFLLSSCSTEAGQCCLSWEFSPFLRATYWKRNCCIFMSLPDRASYSVTLRAFGNMQHVCLVHLLGSVSAMRCSAVFLHTPCVSGTGTRPTSSLVCIPGEGCRVGGGSVSCQLGLPHKIRTLNYKLTSKRRVLCMTFPRNLWHVVPHQGSLFSDNVTFCTPAEVLNPHRIHYISF